jgi:hypothetical protein
MPRQNNRKAVSEEETTRRAHARVIWKHNSFFGHARMMQTNCETIMKSETATSEAKQTANRILAEAKLLSHQLRERVK